MDTIRPVTLISLVVLTSWLAVIGAACGSQSNPSSPSTSTPAAASTVGLSPTSLTFATPTSGAQTFTLTNNDSAALVITAMAASGNFAETDNCVGSVAPGASCTASVTFVPFAVSAGSSTGSVSITDGAGDSPQSVSLTGPAVTGPAAGVLSPTSLTFPAQAIGTASAAQSVTLTNPTNGVSAQLAIATVLASGDFVVTQNNCGRVVAPGGSCTLGVVFVPTAAGARTGALSVFDNAPNLVQSIPLSGTGR